MYTLDNFAEAAETDPILVAPGVWWVGNHRSNETFQAHTYLIEAGDDSVLVDPGSEWNFRRSLSKITKVMPFERIRYFVCQHPDPDITASLPLIDSLTERADARVVTHWRTDQLMQHYTLRMESLCVEAIGWTLLAGERHLTFIFTPYAHFPGAFATLDEATGVLFSSDLFGGFTEGFQLVAEDEGYFESVRPFHEHYMPSREVVLNAMAHIEKHDIRIIAPQHGSIIRGDLVPFMIEKVKGLECGLFLLTDRSTNIERLLLLNKILRQTINTMILYREFNSIASGLTRLMAEMIPVSSLEFYVHTIQEGVLRFSPSNRYRGVNHPPPAAIGALLGRRHDSLPMDNGCRLVRANLPIEDADRPVLLVALPPGEAGTVDFVAVIVLSGELVLDSYVTTMIHRMEGPLQVALERETIYRVLDLEKQKVYARSVRDPLTSCYNRLYMRDVLARQFEMQDRDQAGQSTTLVMCDIDHFKSVNDDFGHNQGDVVLRAVGELIIGEVRGGDLAVRLGGEEFAIFLFASTAPGSLTLAERVRGGVAALTFAGAMAGRRITISCGIAVRRPLEGIESFLDRADAALYRAKRDGRNRIVVEPEPSPSPPIG